MSAADHLRARAQAYRDDANGLRKAGSNWTDIAILDAVADELTRLAIELDHLDQATVDDYLALTHPISSLTGTFAWRCTDQACAVIGIGGPDAAVQHYLQTHSPDPTRERNHPCLKTTESPTSR